MTNSTTKLNTCTFCERKVEIHSKLKIDFNKEGIIKGYHLSVVKWSSNSIPKPHALICKECLTPFHKLFDADLYIEYPKLDKVNP